MWVRLQLDFNWRDFGFGISRLGVPHDKNALSKQISERWCPNGNALPVYSVRSGFELLLETMQWPAGSEIVYSALNIPGMAWLARQHGLVPTPADLDVEQLAPNLNWMAKAITPRTKAIVVAHLYGSVVPMAPIVALARRHDLMVIEDCAENFDGVYTGAGEADASLFSFGPLKTATALAGGVMRVQDRDLFARLKINHDRWPTQSRRDQLNRLCKYGTLKFFGTRPVFGTARRLARFVVGDVDKLIHHTAKSFNEDLTMLRQRPSGPLLASMARRLANFDFARITQRTANGKLLTDLLRGQVLCPGAEVSPHSYWLFPVLMTDSAKALTALADAGFDATRAQSMRSVEAPPDRPELHPANVERLLEHLILVPCYPGIPEAELRRMADVLIRVESESSQVSALKVTMQPAETTSDIGNLMTFGK